LGLGDAGTRHRVGFDEVRGTTRCVRERCVLFGKEEPERRSHMHGRSF
jgi:hypothetical protein